MDYLTLENIKNNKNQISNLIDKNYYLSVFLFFFSCIIFVNSPIPFAAIIKLLGGYFFGFHLGAVYNILATVLACLMGFAISRYALKEIFEKIYFKKLLKIEHEIEKNGLYYFLSLRLIMVVPYFLINILAGISGISFSRYLFSTILGVIPASIIYANGGSRFEQINSISEIFKSETVISLILVALVVLVPVLSKKLSLIRN